MPDDSTKSPGGSPPDFDPLFLHARRELMVSLLAWVVFGVWVVGFSWRQGTRAEAETDHVATILGMPSWVFWGVALPWVLANVFTFWFCFRYMTDNALEVVEDEQRNAPSDRGGSHD